MSKVLILLGVIGLSLGLIFVLFKLLKKGAKYATKLPTNFLIFFLIYALLGLTGFFLEHQVAETPLMLGTLVLLASLTVGIVMTNNLFTKWEWSIDASFAKKFLYLFSLMLTGVLTFVIIFILCEHREDQPSL